MIRLATRLSAAVLPLTLLACRGPVPWEDPAPGVASDEVIAAPVDVVWEALPRVYGAFGLGPTKLDPASRVVESTRRMTVRYSAVGPRDAPIARCSVRVKEHDGAPRAVTYGVHGSVVVTVRTRLGERDGRTRLRTELGASGLPGSMPNCMTTGRLESDILRAVRAAVEPGYVLPESADRGDTARAPF